MEIIISASPKHNSALSLLPKAQANGSVLSPEPMTASISPNINQNIEAVSHSVSEYLKFNTGPDKSNAELSAHILKQNLLGLRAQLEANGAYQSEAFLEEEAALTESLQKNFAAVGVAQFATSSEDWDIPSRISDSIGKVKEGYYDIFENGLKKYVQFYSEYSELVSKLKPYMPGKAGEGKTKFKFEQLKTDLIKLRNKYKGNYELTQLFPPNIPGNTTKAEAEKWMKEMGLPEGCVMQSKFDPNGYYVVLDFAPLEKMINQMPNTIPEKDRAGLTEEQLKFLNDMAPELNNTEYQAWQTGFNSDQESVKTAITSLTGRYSNASSVYDNIVKVLSSTISSYLEMAKRFLSF